MSTNNPRSKHTPEPWRQIRDANQHQQWVIATPRGNYIPKWDSTAPIPWTEHNANADRIVACVNKLAGHPDLDAVEVVPSGAVALLRAVLDTVDGTWPSMPSVTEERAIAAVGRLNAERAAVRELREAAERFANCNEAAERGEPILASCHTDNRNRLRRALAALDSAGGAS